jgi:hypothetical protein
LRHLGQKRGDHTLCRGQELADEGEDLFFVARLFQLDIEGNPAPDVEQRFFQAGDRGLAGADLRPSERRQRLPLQLGIVKNQRDPVAAAAHVQLDPVGPAFDGRRKSGQGILLGVGVIPAVGDNPGGKAIVWRS